MLTNRIVEFLASYGPQPSANNLYDEFVVEAAKQTGCAPLEIEQPLAAELAEMFRSEHPRSVILTGTAGDGKTYTARKVVESLAGSGTRWQNTQKIFNLDVLASSSANRQVCFIKDLSELNELDKTEIYPRVRASLLGEESDLFVICVNDGHLLKFFRDREAEGTSLHDRIAEMLQQDEQNDSDGNFRLINMSRQSHQHLADRIIDAIVRHPHWSHCEGCHVYAVADNPCPIQCNLDILRKTDGASMRARLKDIIRMAAADGRHLSLRQMILLTVNILLGDKKPGRALLTCQKACNRAKNGDFAATNPYANAFGENLNPRERQQYGAFAVLSEFGVGYETNNYFDHSLLWDTGTLPQCAFYGDRIFTSHRERYRLNPGVNVQEFRREMVDQRRRLFFSIDPEAEDVRHNSRRDPWNFSVFKHGASYVQMADALAADNAKIPSSIRRNLVRGLNRMMTGEMTTTDDRIWLTASSGVYLGREIPLLVQQAGGKQQGPTYVTFPKAEGTGKAPVLRVTPMGREPLSVNLILRPTLVECLLRIADGALPASFASECQQEVERFQLQVVMAVREASGGTAPPSEQIEMVNGKLQSHPIEILVAEEDW